MSSRHLQQRLQKRLTPIALAALMAVGTSGLNAAPRTFAGPGSFWDVVANWTGGILPGAGDDAILGGFNTEIRTSFTINSFIGTGSLTASAGTLSFSAASSIGSLNLTGSTLTGTGSLAVAGASTWTTGTMSGTGVTTFAGDLALSTVGLKDITSGRTVNFNGTTTWTTTAASQGRIRTGSTATLNNNGTWLDQNAFTNSITQDFGGPASSFVNAGTYTKSGVATTTIGIGFNNTSSGAGTGVVTLNAGSLLLTGGGTSNGSFVGAAGTAFGFGGNHTLQAASSVNTAGSVDFSGGTNTVAGSFNATTGTTFSGGTTTFTGTVSGLGSTITASGGTGVFNNTQAFNVASLVLTSGGLTFNNTGGVTTNGLTLTGGTLAGTSAVVVNGASVWDGGTMTGAGSTTFNTNLALTTAALKDVTSGRTVNFNGTTTWSTPAASQGRIRTGSTATLNNNGTWLDQNTLTNSITQDFGGPASTFVNAGTYTKSGTAATNIGITFNNTSSGAGTGVVNVNAGSLQLTGGGTSNGSFAGAAGTTLGLGGNHTLQVASSINTAGSVDFSSGTNNLAGAYNAATGTSFSGGTTTFTGAVSGVGSTITASGGVGVFNNTQAFNVSSLVLTNAGGGLTFNNTGGVTTNGLTLNGGTLAGTSAVVVNGPSTWDGGTMTGAGSTTFNTNLALTTAALKDVTSGRTVNFNGTTTWSTPAASQGRIRTGSTATLNNNGTWLDQNTLTNSITQDFGGPASTFVNAGTYTKSGAGTTTIGIAFNNTSSGAGTGVVNVNAGTLQLGGGGASNGSFAGAGTLEFSGGTTTLQAASSVANPNVVFSGGTTTMAGSYNASGTTTFANGGTANFTGTVANSGGALVFSGSGGTANFSNSAGVQFSSLSMLNGSIGGTQTVSFTGPSTWSTGAMTGAGTTTFAGDLALNTNGLKDITGGRTVNFNGTTTWTNATAANGRIRTGSIATLNNNGTWLDQNAFANSITQDFGGPASTFVNAGVYTKSGAGTTSIGIGYNNPGVVNVNAGILQLGGGGTSNGSFAGAGTLEFSGGTATLQAASSVSNPNVVFSGGITNLAGAYNASGTTAFTGGTANFTGTVANSGGVLTFNASGGTANFSNSAGVQFASLTMPAGTIGGTQTVSFTGPSTWTTGTMTAAGTTTFAGDLTVNTNGLKDITNGRVVNFNGTTTWSNLSASGGTFRTGSAATLNNNGTWLDQNAFNNDISNQFGGPASTFTNAGTYTKGAAGITRINIGFNNTATGTVNVNAGQLELNGGGSNAGAINIASGTALIFAGGDYTLGGTLSSTASGRLLAASGTVTNTNVKNFGGQLEIVGGTFNASSAFTAATYAQSAGTVNGTGALTITGPSTWTTGTMTAAGTTTFAGDLAVNTNGLKDITNGRIVNFNGTTTWTNASANSGQIRTGSAATLNNNGTWLDQNAFNNDISNQFGGPASTFANAGTYTKSGASITRFGVGFNNAAAGTVNVNAGNLEFNGGGNNAGAINIAGGTALIFAGGDYTLGGTLSSTASGRLLAASGTVTNTNVKNFGGQLEIVGGTFNATSAFTSANYLQSAGIVTGPGTLTVTGPATWTTGAMTGTGTTTFAGALAVSTDGLKDITNGRAVNFNGTTTWANASSGGGAIRTGSTATLTNNGTWLDQNAFANAMRQDFGGPESTFVNAGSYTKSGAASTSISIAFNNTGTVNVNAGTLQTTAAGLLRNFSGTTLTGGNFNVTGASTFSFPGANVVTNAAGITLDGAGSQFLNNSSLTSGLANFATNTADGSFTIRNGRNFSTAGNFGNAGLVSVGTGSTFTTAGAGNFTNLTGGTLEMAGGSFAAGTLGNAGTVSGFGTVTPAISNSGLLRATGGTLVASNGVLGATGNITVDGGATLNLSSAGLASTARVLAQNGSLNLGTQNITVFKDYNNANFASGNSFAARAGVSGAGLILGQNASQTLTGQVVAGGANAFTVDFGNVRGGTTATRTFQIANNGTGADIRGALQTGGPGLGNLSDTRLSGTGTVAANFGPVLFGTNGGDLGITLNAAGAGGALSGQSFAVVSNFSNVATQTVALSGFSTVLAQGAATPGGPLSLGNFRVGVPPAVSTHLAVSNTTTGAGAEQLGIGSASATGNFSASNNLGAGLVAAGATSANAVTVASAGGTVGVNNGSATLQFVSNGQAFDASFASLATNQQTLAVQATGFLQAQPALPANVAVGNYRLTTGASSAFTLTNTNLAPAGFQEVLNATSGSTTAGVTLQGNVTGLAAGASSNNFVIGFAAGGAAGARSGSANVTLVSDGTGTSGLGLLGLSNGVVGITGTAFNVAAGSATPSPVVVSNQRLNGIGGGTASVALNVANTAAAGSFSEALNASFTGVTGQATTNGGSFTNLAAGSSNATALTVSVNNTQAGNRSGSITLGYQTDGTGSNGNSGLAAVAAGTQTINVSGNVFRLAGASSVTPATVTLADQRIGGSLFQLLTLANTAAADGFSEGLNASITANGTASAAGSFSLLAAGASSNALSVGVTTNTAGAKSGTATITLASDGTGTSGFAAFGLNSQTVNVSGNVFRLAQPVVDTTPLVMIARVGDAALSRNIGVSNNAPDLFTERLNASIGSSPAGTSAGPALLGLAPNAGGNLLLNLPTTTAGSFSGPVSVALVSSSAGTTSGAPDFSLGSVNVGLTGRVYAPAVAQVAPTVIDFGTVRVGDVVTARTVTVANTATGALTDSLRATLSGGGAPFTTSGTVAGLAAGASNSTGLQVQLATTSAGVFAGLATVAATSQNPDLADLTLTPAGITLQGRVNNLAQVALAKSGGSGSFSGTAFSYTLDFGTVLVDSGALSGTLSLANAATGTADALAGSWNLAVLAGGPFSVAGFDAFTGLAAGGQLGGLTVSFNVGTEGSFTRTVVLNGLSTNGSGPDLALSPITLQLQGTVVAVPEPGTYLMMAVGVLAMGSIARRKLRARRD